MQLLSCFETLLPGFLPQGAPDGKSWLLHLPGALALDGTLVTDLGFRMSGLLEVSEGALAKTLGLVFVGITWKRRFPFSPSTLVRTIPADYEELGFSQAQDLDNVLCSYGLKCDCNAELIPRRNSQDKTLVQWLAQHTKGFAQP